MSPARAGRGAATARAAGALAHLRAADPILGALIAGLGDIGLESPAQAQAAGRPPPGSAHYASLVRAIVGQQLSTHAARAIWGRLLERSGGRPPEPAEVLAADPEELRAAVGLSRAKVSFLRSLAEHVQSGELDLAGLQRLPDEEIVAELTAVRGLGVWSAQMFLMFHLERPDVLPVGDLGIRRAIARAYGLDGLPDSGTIEAIAEPWRPHRTLACRYLWRSLRNEPA